MDYYSNCLPGEFRGPDQLQFQSWSAKTAVVNGSNDLTVNVPLYSNFLLDKTNLNVKKAIITQHGNLRNANTYFCSVVTSIVGIDEYSDKLGEYLIIAPQFLIDGDVCWDSHTNQRLTVKTSEGITCGYPIFTSEGWKDGQSSVSVPPTYYSNLPNPFYSYDVYNLLLAHLSDKSFFPNLSEVVLAGFSAGAQTLLRYALLPSIHNSAVHLRFVISDPSTYVYLDELRYPPIQSGVSQRGVPNVSWLPPTWKVLLHVYFSLFCRDMVFVS